MANTEVKKVELKETKFAQRWETIPGTTYKMVNRIPTEEKEKLVQIMADILFVEDEDHNVCYIDHRQCEVMDYMMIGAYTNINIDGVSISKVLDNLSPESVDAVRDYCGDDYGDVIHMAKQLFGNAEKMFDAKHGIGGLLTTLVNMFANGENEGKNIFENRELLEKMFEVVDGMQKDKGKKDKNKLDIRVDGAKLDFSKK